LVLFELHTRTQFIPPSPLLNSRYDELSVIFLFSSCVYFAVFPALPSRATQSLQKMSINSSGAVLMEPLSNGRRPGPPTGPPTSYPRPTGPSNACHLPPVRQSQNPSNGAWHGNPMPLPYEASGVHSLNSSSSPPGPGPSSSPMLMRSGCRMGGTPLPTAPNRPPSSNYANHSPRPMPPPGTSPRALIGPLQQPQAQLMRGQRPPSGSGSPIMSPVNMSSINSSSSGVPVNGSYNGGQQQRPPMPPPHHLQVRRGPRVPSVARGPQPTSVEPTRLRDGRKIKEVQRQQQGNPSSGEAGEGAAHRGPHRFTGPGKNGMAAKQNNKTEPQPIKTTVGADESWVKGLTYSTWIDSPRGNLNDLDSKEGPYKRHGGNGKNRRKPQKKHSSRSSNSGGVMEMLRNLFR
jgi:hypothetical protein